MRLLRADLEPRRWVSLMIESLGPRAGLCLSRGAFEQVELGSTSSLLCELEQGLPLWASVFKNIDIFFKKR